MAIHIRRRELIAALGGVAAAWPLAARGQQSGAGPLIGILSPLSERAAKRNIDAFRAGIRAAELRNTHFFTHMAGTPTHRIQAPATRHIVRAARHIGSRARTDDEGMFRTIE